MKFFKKHAKIICILLASVILLGSVCVFAYCSLNKAPELDEVKGGFICLIENSKQVNEIFFGVGLPVYERDGDLDEQNMIYIGEANRGYDRVMELSPYATIEEMKAAAQRVYSSAYCEQLFQTCFDGVLYEGVTVLDYSVIGEVLYQSSVKEAITKEERIYIYSTMKIVRPSNKEYVNVEIQSYLESTPDKIETDRLSFLYEDGNWYLDTPTY